MSASPIDSALCRGGGDANRVHSEAEGCAARVPEHGPLERLQAVCVPFGRSIATVAGLRFLEERSPLNPAGQIVRPRPRPVRKPPLLRSRRRGVPCGASRRAPRAGQRRLRELHDRVRGRPRADRRIGLSRRDAIGTMAHAGSSRDGVFSHPVGRCGRRAAADQSAWQATAWTQTSAMPGSTGGFMRTVLSGSAQVGSR